MSGSRSMPRAWLGVVVSSLLAAAPAAQQPTSGPKPSPEISRFSKAIAGEYTVTETHHARPGSPEWSISGTASYRSGPDGLSVIEEYASNNPRGPFTAIAVIWWDEALRAFKHFECETGEACGVVDDTGSWEGDTVVFVRRMERQGRTIQGEARYDLSEAPRRITYSTRFSVDGSAPVTSMTIVYERKR